MIEIVVMDVNLYYGNKQALESISMDMEKNSVTALIGPSGCGKSTLLRCLNRMNDLIEGVRIEGNIVLGDKDIYDPQIDVNELRKRVGMVFQKPTPFPKSIFDNVAYGLRVNGMTNKTELTDRVESSLKASALWDEVKDDLKKSALALSGGQQQRLCIARTIAVQPEVVLMDEPTSALDPISTEKIEDLIQELKKDFTIVIVTHNMQQATRISDKTAFFYLGKLIEYNKTDELFNNPKEEKTKEYVTGRFG